MTLEDFRKKENVNAIRERDGVLLRRVGDIIGGLILAAIIGLTTSNLALWVSITALQTQFKGFQEISAIQVENMELTMKAQAAIVERITTGGFNATQGKELTGRVDRNDDRLHKLGHDLAVGLERMDARLRNIEKELDRNTIGQMKGQK